MKIIFRKGFTIMELMIVLAIIAIILAITVPGYVRIREVSIRTGCLANLKQIDAAIEVWAVDEAIPEGTVPSAEDEEDIYSGYLRGGKPRCPGRGEYTLNAVGGAEQVTCSLAEKGHRL